MRCNEDGAREGVYEEGSSALAEYGIRAQGRVGRWRGSCLL